MKWLLTGLIIALTVSEAVGSRDWFSKAVYNKWHETELERWLSDHDVPYPSPADRKDLEELVKKNWESYVTEPASKTVEEVSDSFNDAEEWIFDSWSDSQLKAFLDRHGIPCPQPKKRDTLLSTARRNYEAIAQKLGQSVNYPGNWLYEHWSESELKEYLDSHGYPVPQPTSRDKLIAAVRRNSRRAGIEGQKSAAAASASMAAAQETLAEALFNAWSESDFKKFFDEHGIKVPQGSKRNEMLALARKHRRALLEKPSASMASVYGAATSKAGNEFARATDDTQLKMEDAFNQVINGWSNTRLKAYLDARGIPVPQSDKRDELLAKVRLHGHKAASGYTAWTFDTWNKENLGKYLSSQHKKALEGVEYTRDELLKQAQDAYNRASKAGGPDFTSITNYLAQVTGSMKDINFNTWSKEDIEKFLASYGIKPTRGSSIEELRRQAKDNADYFRYGVTRQEASMFSRLQSLGEWAWDQLKIGALSGRAEGQKAAQEVEEKATKASDEL
ncbi:hypothetical protein H106_07572 [Trichophyton rubrum CBS 735.88]|nr:hypothetical protein H106_07572 [Trichophyton rubrum CBS 735.88]